MFIANLTPGRCGISARGFCFGVFMAYIPDKIKNFVLDRDGNRCIYCGKKVSMFWYIDSYNMTLDDRLEFDHFIPVSHGGEAKRTNIVVSCHICNCKKRNHDPGDYLSFNEYKRIKDHILAKECSTVKIAEAF